MNKDVIIQFSDHWFLISGYSRWKPLPHEVMSLIPLKPFWLNQRLDRISTYPLPNKPTEPHFTEMHSFSSYSSYLWAEVFRPSVSSLCSWPLRGGGSHLHWEKIEREKARLRDSGFYWRNKQKKGIRIEILKKPRERKNLFCTSAGNYFTARKRERRMCWKIAKMTLYCSLDAITYSDPLSKLHSVATK